MLRSALLPMSTKPKQVQRQTCTRGCTVCHMIHSGKRQVGTCRKRTTMCTCLMREVAVSPGLRPLRCGSALDLPSSSTSFSSSHLTGSSPPSPLLLLPVGGQQQGQRTPPADDAQCIADTLCPSQAGRTTVPKHSVTGRHEQHNVSKERHLQCGSWRWQSSRASRARWPPATCRRCRSGS